MKYMSLTFSEGKTKNYSSTLIFNFVFYNSLTIILKYIYVIDINMRLNIFVKTNFSVHLISLQL